MRRHVCILLAACLAAGAGACRPTERAADGPTLLAVGNRKNLFVLTADPVSGEPGFRLWQGDARGEWHACEPGRGVPVAAAAYRERALLLFRSGRYGLFGLGRPDVYESPVPGWTPMAGCEDGLALDAMGWDPSGTPLYARWDGEASWQRERVDVALSAETLLEPTAVRYLDRVYLLWREQASGTFLGDEQFRVRFAWRDAEGWRLASPSRIRLLEGPSVAATSDRMVCLYRKPAAGGEPGPWAVATYETTDEDFHETAEVRSDSPLPEGRLALARWDKGFVLVGGTDAGPAVARLDPETGRADAFESIGAEAERPGDAANEGLLETVVFGIVLAGLLVLVVGGRAAARRQATAAELYPEGVVPAPLLRRVGAAVIDHLLVGVVVAIVLLATMPGIGERLTSGEPLSWRELLAVQGPEVVALLLYFTFAESVWGRTIGKKLLGLEVRLVSGAKLTTGRALLRNVLRIVDRLPMLYFVGMVAILLGPRPQRLGDRAAGTLVVLRRSPTEQS
jgi:uncharacterized RDD family membrane protein YckC